MLIDWNSRRSSIRRLVAVEGVHWSLLLLTMEVLATHLLVGYADGIRCISVILGFGGISWREEVNPLTGISLPNIVCSHI